MPSWSDAKRILAVRLDTLGDVLMTTPAIRALSESPARPQVTLLTSVAGGAVAPLIREIDDTIVYAAPWMKASGAHADAAPDFQMIERLRAGRFDAAVIFTVFSQNPLPAALLCYLSGIPLRLSHCRENPYTLLTDWVKDPEPENGIRHEVRRHLDLVGAAGFRPAHERLSLQATPAGRARAMARLLANGVDPDDPFILVHPGASAASRRYPPENFALAARAIAAESDAPLVFTGSADEGPLIDGIRAAIGGSTVSLAGQLSLDELTAAIESAALLIANNTGPAHMAAALGTPVVDLYALTNPQHTPWQVPSRVLFHDVPCRNCFKSVCPEGHGNCLRLVPPDAVASAARELAPHLFTRRTACIPSV